MKSKEILAAGIVRDIRFINSEAAVRYVSMYRSGACKILDARNCDDGSVIYRIVTCYNDSPLIQLYEED